MSLRHPEMQYIDLLEKVLKYGDDVPDRTGTGCRSIKCEVLKFDLQNGFPLLTTKKMYTKQLVGELIGFIRGYDNAENFRKLGCTIWDANANDDAGWLNNPNRKGVDDLGRIYGVQWRRWESHNKQDGGLTYTDQLAELVYKLETNPYDRRMIVTAYNPGELDKMSLPPCHMFFQCGIENGDELVINMFQRSCDLFLGVPFNIASYALLNHLLARATGFKPGRLIMSLFDVHLYSNHLEQAREQLTRIPLPLCDVEVPQKEDNQSPMDYLESLCPEDIIFLNYQSHGPIKAPMAVQ